jgi:hypothetical protein
MHVLKLAYQFPYRCQMLAVQTLANFLSRLEVIISVDVGLDDPFSTLAPFHSYLLIYFSLYQASYLIRLVHLLLLSLSFSQQIQSSFLNFYVNRYHRMVLAIYQLSTKDFLGL